MHETVNNYCEKNTLSISKMDNFLFEKKKLKYIILGLLIKIKYKIML